MPETLTRSAVGIAGSIIAATGAAVILMDVDDEPVTCAEIGFVP